MSQKRILLFWASFLKQVPGTCFRISTRYLPHLDPTPKFVRERLAAAEEAAESNGGIGSSDPALFDRRVHDAA